MFPLRATATLRVEWNLRLDRWPGGEIQESKKWIASIAYRREPSLVIPVSGAICIIPFFQETDRRNAERMTSFSPSHQARPRTCSPQSYRHGDFRDPYV